MVLVLLAILTVISSDVRAQDQDAVNGDPASRPTITQGNVPGYSIDLQTSPGLDTFVLTGPHKDVLQINLPDTVYLNSPFTGSIKLYNTTTTTVGNDFTGDILKIGQWTCPIKEGTFIFQPDTGSSSPATKAGNSLTKVNIDITDKSSAFLGHSEFFELDQHYDAKVNAHLFPNLWDGGWEFAAGDPLKDSLRKEVYREKEFYREQTSATSGDPVRFSCPGCTGIVGPGDYLKIGDLKVPFLAETPGRLIVLDSYDKPGLTEVEAKIGDSIGKHWFRNVTLGLSADNLNLIKGQSTKVHIVVSGLEDLKGSANMTIEVTGTVSMTGSTDVTIKPSDISSAGVYTTNRALHAVSAGGFGVVVKVMVDEPSR